MNMQARVLGSKNLLIALDSLRLINKISIKSQLMELQGILLDILILSFPLIDFFFWFIPRELNCMLAFTCKEYHTLLY